MNKLSLDFVSDISCPWCAIGLQSLLQAMDRVKDTVDVTLRFQPFELNPQMGPQGQDIDEHLSEKYGTTAEQNAQTRAMIKERAQAVGLDFRMDKRSRIYNTFDAHRLLHWAGLQSAAAQLALKQALFKAYFTEGLNPGDHEVLTQAAHQVGLDEAQARAVLATNAHADEVREDAQAYIEAGIRSVPSMVINNRHLLQGGQPVEVFEQVLRDIAMQDGPNGPPH